MVSLFSPQLSLVLIVPSHGGMAVQKNDVAGWLYIEMVTRLPNWARRS